MDARGTLRRVMRAPCIALVSIGLALSGGCPDDEDERAVAPEQPTEEAEPAEDEAPVDRSVDEETAAALEALGYVPTTPTDNPEDQGVTSRDEQAATEGLNLYSTRHEASALLVDMDGEVVHRWEAPDADEPQRRWMHVEPLPTGELLAIAKDKDLTKHAWDSSVVWRRDLRAHHDLAVHDDGRIFVLTREEDELEVAGRTLPILADSVTILSPEGEAQRTIELVPLMRDHLDERRLSRLARAVEAGTTPPHRLVQAGQVGDVLHTNSIAFLDRDIEGVAPAGSVLLSFRNADRVAILSPELDEVLWAWGQGELDAQHDATQLGNGNVLLFDNGMLRGTSRVVEVDPRTDEIAWSYGPDDLFTRLRGGAQELPSGNILITESDRGHVVEVTREGEQVWEYWNPDVRGEGDDAERGIIYRMNRFPSSFFRPLGQ